VRYTDGTATIRPLLSDENALMVVRLHDFSATELYNHLADFVAEVFGQ
jgi:hypothetical protein